MNKFIYSLIALLSITGLQAQNPERPPKLVVTIVVDQLRGDYLQYFSSTFGEKGFKRLLNEGLVYHQADYGFPNLSEATSVAAVHTGTYPYYNGIAGNMKYDQDLKKEVSIVTDKDYLGNYTSEHYSPLALQSSTIADELKKATQGSCDVFSIAPNPEQAIIAGGRSANAALWLDNYNGKWATSTYYKDIPWYLDRFNSTETIGNFSEKTWIQGLSNYNGFPYSGSRKYFSYSFPKSDNDRYRKIKQTAIINEQVTNLANKILEHAGFGSRSNPDLLALTYYAGNYPYAVNTDEYNYEIQDIYYKLDKELEKLFDMIERKVGMKNTLIVLTSSGYFDSTIDLMSETQVFGKFYPNRCTALLNMYLIATYGNGQWVESYYDNQIYLNKKLAEEKELNWNSIVKDAADFVAQFSGVQEVTTLSQWLVDDIGRAADFRRGMNKKYSGDLFIELQPGWVVIEDESKLTVTNRECSILSPTIFLGVHAKKEHIYRKIKVTQIAPTLSYILRIRPPNGTKDLPLQEFLK
ncbi:alkaline phosphatase family protein [Bacteroidales bacterium OttesenSCG-928-I14]|nr:alkaline phosphatase family protein [Bacteroidales bacterium OttesenSCG-928-I14]